MQRLLTLFGKSCVASLFILFIPTILFAQKVTLSGYLRDSATGESLISATIYIKEADQGGVSNNYGFYSVSVPPRRLYGHIFLRWVFTTYRNDRHYKRQNLQCRATQQCRA